MPSLPLFEYPFLRYKNITEAYNGKRLIKHLHTLRETTEEPLK